MESYSAYREELEKQLNRLTPPFDMERYILENSIRIRTPTPPPPPSHSSLSNKHFTANGDSEGEEEEEDVKYILNDPTIIISDTEESESEESETCGGGGGPPPLLPLNTPQTSAFYEACQEYFRSCLGSSEWHGSHISNRMIQQNRTSVIRRVETTPDGTRSIFIVNIDR